MEGELHDKRLVLATFDKFNNPDNKSGEDEAQELLSQLSSHLSIADCSDKDKFTLLHHACYNGWYNVAKRLLKDCNCDPNIKNASGSLPIHLACLGGNKNLIDYIASLPGAKPNDRDNSGITPLHYAVLKGNKQVVECLIVKYTADPNSKDNSGQTPLHIACKSGHLDIVDYLVDEQYCDPKCANNGGWTPLHLACQNGYLDVAKYLIEEQNCKPAQCHNKTNGSTPLHLACQNGHLAVAKYLVGEKHYDPSSKDLFGWTAMHSASETGQLNIVEYLIEERCSHDETSDGHTPLYLACQNGHYDIVMFLVREQHFSPDCDLWKPLCIACENGYIDIVKYLIGKLPKNWKANAWVLLNYACENGHLRIVRYLVEEHHCDPTQTNSADGMTLLHSACRNGHMDVVKYLIEEKSCVPTRSSCDGWTPLHFACQNGHVIVARYLIQEQDCNPACENNSGWTPLHSASEYGHTAVVQYLVNEQYCSTTCRNRNGWTPLLLACRNGHIGVAEYFMESYDIADVDSDGCTPLHLACQSGHLGLVKTLVSNYRTRYGHQRLVEFIIHHDVNDQYKLLSSSSSPFFTALMKGHLNIVNYFVDTVVEQHATKSKGCTYLHSACVIGDLDIVKYLIQMTYCDPQCQDDDGWTPLHYSCKHGHIQIVEHLVNEQNCKIVCYTNDRSTPFSIAVDNSHNDIALFLIQKQFSHLTIDQNSRWSLLHSACQAGELDIVKFLVKGKHVDPHCRDSNGLAPLHIACENGHLDIVKYLTQEVDCDPMCMTSDAWTPLHSASKNGRTDILKYLIEEKQCNCNCKVFKSITPLHLTCRHGHLDSVVYLINCHSSMLHDNGILDEALSSGNDDIVLLLLSHGVRLSSNVQYGGPGGSILVQPALKVFLLGNPMSGKSTLVQAVLSNLSQDGWLNHKLNKLLNPKVAGVEPYTAGIIPHHFHNPCCGYLILYDFAGQYEHYSSSHAAVLEHLGIANSCTGCLVLIFADIRKQEEELIGELQYWNSFVLNQDIQPRVVVIGSHADIAKSDGKEKLFRALAKVPDLAGSTVITLDCTGTSSTGLTRLCSCLSAYSSQHLEQFKIGAQTHFLNRLLRQKFKDQIACQLCDISGYINSEENLSLRRNNLLPINSASLIEHLSILSEQGQVMFMKDSVHIDNSWIILNEEVLLSHVNGSMFAPNREGFKSIHIQFSSTGVVALSKIKEAFPTYNPQMLIGFMTHLDFCRKMEQTEVLLFGDQQDNTGNNENEVYYFFPALVNVDCPVKSCLSILDMKDKKYKCGWCLCCPSGKFFMSRFLHVLLLDLAFSHALPADPLLSTLEIKCRQCNIWKNGIHWQNNDGVEALIEVVEQNTAVILIMGCLQGREIECTQHRSRLIHNILRIKKQYSGAVECKEAFIHPKEVSMYPLKTANDLFTFSINQLATAILDKKDIISSKFGMAQEMIEISDILYFEPFTCLSDQIISCLCNESCAENEVSEDFLHDCAKVAYRRMDLIKKVIILLPEQESELIGENEQYQDQYSKDPIHQCFLIFRTWKKFIPNPTLKQLRETLDKYSVFRGRNPLDYKL